MKKIEAHKPYIVKEKINTRIWIYMQDANKQWIKTTLTLFPGQKFTLAELAVRHEWVFTSYVDQLKELVNVALERNLIEAVKEEQQ